MRMYVTAVVSNLALTRDERLTAYEEISRVTEQNMAKTEVPIRFVVR